MLVSVLHPKSQWHTRRAYFEPIRPILLGFAIVRADRVKEYGIIWVSKDAYEHFWYLGPILRVFSAICGSLVQRLDWRDALGAGCLEDSRAVAF